MREQEKVTGHAILETVSFYFQDQLWAAISVRISEKNDVYVNYLGDDKKRHTSYHASGQMNQKVGKRYVQWTAGPSGHWEPMKEFKDKPTAVCGRESVAVWGWRIASIPELPRSYDTSEMVVDVSTLPHPKACDVLGFEVSIVDRDAEERSEILGFPVVQRCRISNGVVVVEIEAFFVEEDTDP